ncbi:hypothetical protein ASPSYDRAFT_452841 [Aspergillus sydowii CBS 593.65]|uniref:Uncharacterized protein n=1 Tax=Aspergillus sydowii CBS 593.65 TaxID=1036612 RepID=A0A1L9T6Z1_9EURO|nr:uncharacterized protein ASPSYDRAFT_452841 [Aspergillus sydowii CBS 593.65]OJJ55214.1 hypothetical protein ASPSYDRAFT_452841 [Aspergillus sydowii CBS 593.65]
MSRLGCMWALPRCSVLLVSTVIMHDQASGSALETAWTASYVHVACFYIFLDTLMPFTPFGCCFAVDSRSRPLYRCRARVRR